MKICRFELVVALLLITSNGLRGDDWPVPRGPSREPLPYRYDPKVLHSIPKGFLDDSTACVLYSGTTNLLEADGTVEAISHEITRLNSRKGIEKLGEYRSISYDPSYEKLTLNEARVIKANGTFIPIEPRHIQLRDVATDFQVYDESKQLVISFPNLQVGDAYEVKWTVRGRNREFNGDFFSRYTFGDDNLPVLRDEFRVRVPKNKTLKYAAINGKIDLQVTENDGAKFYVWGATNRKELPRDEDRPSKEELRLQVMVSTFPSWEAIGKWKQKLRAECWKCTPEVRKIVDDVTRDLKTPEEKARALTYWVRRNIRYLSRGPAGSGYTPHQPHQVIANRYGDCKDQAQLLAVMLREIGLPVWLVTLGTVDDGQVLADVPSPWGSHAILLTKIDGKDYWIDTTVSLAAWDFLPRADRDRHAYITQEADLKLVKTPPFTYQDYRIEQTTHVTIAPDGTTHNKRQASYHGSSAWAKRDRWLEVPPGERRRIITAELQDAHSKVRLLSLKIDDRQLLEFDQPVRAETEFEVPKHFTVSDKLTREGSFTDSPIWTWFLGYNLDVDRQLPFVLPTQFESIHQYIVQLPVAYRLDGLPEEQDIRSPWGFFKLKVVSDRANPHRLELHMHMRLEKKRVETKELSQFVHFQEEVNRAYRVWLNLRPTSDIADAVAIEKLLAKQKPAESQSVKILAKLYMDHDRMSEARRVLDQATSWFPSERAIWELRVQTAEHGPEEERLYRTMLKQFPEEPRYAVALGAACVRRGEHQEAEKILTPLTKHASSVVRGAVHYQLARSTDRQNNPQAALTHLQSALFADPPSLATNDAMLFKARVHEKLGQRKEAIQTLQTALEADPTAREILEHIIHVELEAGQREAALDHLRRYTVAAGKDPASVLKAAELHYQLKRFEDAYELASRASDLGLPGKAQRILGFIQLHKQEYQQAAAHLDRSDLDVKALAGLIQSYLRLGQLDDAQRRIEMIRRVPDAGKELFALERDVLLLVDRRAKLLAEWNSAKDQRPAATRVVNQFLCAERGLAERWSRDQVERLVRAGVAEGLEFGPLLALRGWLRLERGQLRQALGDAEAALQVYPSDTRAYLVRGRVRLEQANLTLAVPDLRKAAELSRRQDPLVLHWLAAALLEAGQAKEAVETQRLALLLRPGDADIQEQLKRMEQRK